MEIRNARLEREREEERAKELRQMDALAESTLAKLKRHGLDGYPTVTVIPEGWGITEGASAPIGTRWIDNRKSRFGGERKSALILLPWFIRAMAERENNEK